MAKFDFKQFLLQKGEKVGLIGAAAGGGLLFVLGVTNLASAPSASEQAKLLQNGTSGIRTKIANDDGSSAKELPPWVKGGGVEFNKVDTAPFTDKAFVNYAFEPVDTPSKLRDNPPVLGIVEAQLDLVRVPFQAYDVQVLENGQRRIGVLTKAAKVSEADTKGILDALKNRKSQLGRGAPAGRLGGNLPPGGGGMPGAPGGGGMPGAPGGGGMPGAPGGGGMPGAPGGRGGLGSPDGGGMPPSGGFDQSGERYETSVSYISVDEFDKQKVPPTPALTVYPLRMTVIHAVVPVREQLEEIRKALRLMTLDDARRESMSVGGQPSGAAGSGGGGNMLPPAAGPGRGGLGSPDGGGDGGMNGPGAGAALNGFAPVYDGFDVQRKLIDPSGHVYDWQDYYHEDAYVDKIWSRKFGDQADDGYLSYFLRYDQKMAAPYPSVSEGINVYPPLRLNRIRDAVQKMMDSRKVPITRNAQKERFGKNTGGSNPFAPQLTGGSGGGGAGGGNSGFGGFFGGGASGPGVGPSGPGAPGAPGAGGGRGGMMPPGGMLPPAGGGGMMPPAAGGGGGKRPPGGGMMPPGGMLPPAGGGRGGAPGIVSGPETPDQDSLLLRFFDVNIEPGWSYQYRIRVRLKNPNYNRKDVARPDDAKKEVLTGNWQVINTVVSVPPEQNIYAADPVAYHEKLREKYRDPAILALLDNKDGTLPVVQVQRWMPEVRIEGTKREPIGNWVVGEVTVRPGEKIGKKQILELPMWSAEKGTYLLQELPRYTIKNAREKPKGLLVDFETPLMLVDYEGGKMRPQIGERAVSDEAGTELLVLDTTDGSVRVRSSVTDTDDKDRVAREKGWTDWIARVKDTTNRVGLPTGGMPGPGGDSGGFGRSGPGGGN